jgi:hypothetical protein
LGVAILGAASGALTYGTGYDEARSILENHAHLSWVYAPARAAAIATALSRLVSRPLYQSLADRYATAPRTS